MIQRDYAQGRVDAEEVRSEFLAALHGALMKPLGNPSLPLNLDFIYGSVEGAEEPRFLPLDGQQRLTTLFLLHWFLAWKEDQWDAFAAEFVIDGASRFNYSIRPSCNEFFDSLVRFRPELAPGNTQPISSVIADQPWYFRSWRLDPTIQAVLVMLDAIEQRFAESTGLYARLVDRDQPSITFQLLALEKFGLSDDLYIKMNARGKPLTAFETFKARYEQELVLHLQNEKFEIGGHLFTTADYVARRIDTAWADLLWRHRQMGVGLADDAFMNLFRLVALSSRDFDAPKVTDEIQTLRSSFQPPPYSVFHSRNWLDEPFTETLIRLLDAWCTDTGELRCQLPDGANVVEGKLFEQVLERGSDQPYAELAQIVGYVRYIVRNHQRLDPHQFQDWMRVIRNLVINTGYNRPDDLRRSLQGITSMLGDSTDVLSYLATTERPVTGFSEVQIAEEVLKARLIQADQSWRDPIHRAESHGYFKGQIGFLLEFSGVESAAAEASPSSWSEADHSTHQVAFERELTIASCMFLAKGLNDSGKHLWQRALLTRGDYLLPSGRNRSFLVDSAGEEGSWKRLLSGSTPAAARARRLLKGLFSALSADKPIEAQLIAMIGDCEGVEPWRNALVSDPKLIDYCERRALREDDRGHLYLLKRVQMNGAHAELFGLALFHRIQRGELALKMFQARYEVVNDTYTEPWLELRGRGVSLRARVEYDASCDDFDIAVSTKGINEGVLGVLVAAGLAEVNDCLAMSIKREAIDEKLLALDQALSSLKESVGDA